MSIGIDYGMGTTNINLKTGIRYGVIPANDVGQVWLEDAEADYGDPACPICGGEVSTCGDAVARDDIEEYEQYGRGCADYECHKCHHTLDSQDCFGEQAIGFHYSGEGYELSQSGDDRDIFVISSPYYTLAPFCSPCAPGACYLPSAHENGVKAYCLGHEWFEDSIAPYSVYSVESGEIVPPPVGF